MAEPGESGLQAGLGQAFQGEQGAAAALLGKKLTVQPLAGGKAFPVDLLRAVTRLIVGQTGKIPAGPCQLPPLLLLVIAPLTGGDDRQRLRVDGAGQIKRQPPGLGHQA
jgi:hypothetical protein